MHAHRLVLYGLATVVGLCIAFLVWAFFNLAREARNERRTTDSARHSRR